jgi:hypothetical protein
MPAAETMRRWRRRRGHRGNEPLVVVDPPRLLRRDEGRPREQVPGGVVPGRHRTADGPPLPEPGVRAAVPEHQEPGLRFTRAATAVPGRPPPARGRATPAARRMQWTVTRLTVRPSCACRGSGRCVVFKPAYSRRASVRIYLLPRGLRQAAPRGAAPVPGDEGPPAGLPHPGEELPDVPETPAQKLGRLGSGQPVFEHQVEDMVPLQLVLAHRDRLRLWIHRPSLPMGEPTR